MASVIWLFPPTDQVRANSYIWSRELQIGEVDGLKSNRGTGYGEKVLIAKGNIIEGIEAKE